MGEELQPTPETSRPPQEVVAGARETAHAREVTRGLRGIAREEAGAGDPLSSMVGCTHDETWPVVPGRVTLSCLLLNRRACSHSCLYYCVGFSGDDGVPVVSVARGRI